MKKIILFTAIALLMSSCFLLNPNFSFDWRDHWQPYDIYSISITQANEIMTVDVSLDNEVFKEMMESKSENEAEDYEAPNKLFLWVNPIFDHDDLLTENCLYEVVKVINNQNADFIYTDEDKTDEEAKEFFGPHFKQDWAPFTLRSYNYITHFSVFKKELLEKVGNFRSEYDGSQDYDIILRLTEKAFAFPFLSY